jgi:hypothetical protein
MFRLWFTLENFQIQNRSVIASVNSPGQIRRQPAFVCTPIRRSHTLKPRIAECHLWQPIYMQRRQGRMEVWRRYGACGEKKQSQGSCWKSNPSSNTSSARVLYSFPNINTHNYVKFWVNFHTTNIMFLYIIHRLVFYLKHDVSVTRFCLHLQVRPTQLSPMDRASPYLRISNYLLNKMAVSWTVTRVDFKVYTKVSEEHSVFIFRLELCGVLAQFGYISKF